MCQFASLRAKLTAAVAAAIAIAVAATRVTTSSRGDQISDAAVGAKMTLLFFLRLFARDTPDADADAVEWWLISERVGGLEQRGYCTCLEFN